jgi:hypothetical protein
LQKHNLKYFIYFLSFAAMGGNAVQMFSGLRTNTQACDANPANLPNAVFSFKAIIRIIIDYFSRKGKIF